MKLTQIICSLFLLFLSPSFTIGQSITPENLDQWTKAILPQAVAEHRTFVSIPNIPLTPEDMDKNLRWLKEAFTKRGFQFRALETESIPLGFARKFVDPNLPTVLFYLHFDGQPVAPPRWDQDDPFVPVLKAKNAEGELAPISWAKAKENIDLDWRVFARSAADDKGPIIMFLNALDLMEQQKIPLAFNVKIILDGEEEYSSAGLKNTLEKYKPYYAADHLIIMDGPAHPTNQPTLTFGCRGIASGTLTVYGPKVSQHSGHYGNYAPNPVFKMAHLLASMKDEDGRVLIKGFYDGIDLDKETQALLASVPDDQKAINAGIGVAEAEKVGKNYQESLQYPSLNIRGMSSAWIGRQTRTIVPDKAVAQIGIRLVVESDGDRLLELLKNHIQEQGYYLLDHEPTDEERLIHPNIATFVGKKAVNAFRTDVDAPTGQWLTKGIQKAHGQAPVRIRTMGGTVPVTPIIEALGVPAVIVPMVNMDNNQHSPNENLRLGNLYNGIKTCVGVLSEKIE